MPNYPIARCASAKDIGSGTIALNNFDLDVRK